MPVDLHRWRIPDVVEAPLEPLAAHDRVSAAADDKIDLSGVLPIRHGPLAREEDIEGDLDAGCEAVSLARARMRDNGAATAVGRTRELCQTLDLGVDCFLR